MPREILQDRYAPASVCFGCGPSNPHGLKIKSWAEGDEVLCEWEPRSEHCAFEGVLNGGIISTILDCHSNWTAVHGFMVRDHVSSPPPTVTAEFTLRLRRPTPMGTVLRLRGRAVELSGERAVVESTLEGGGAVTAAFRGTFAVVRKDHPAYFRWTGGERDHRAKF